MSNTAPIIILGTGLAGYTLAREIRKRDTTIPITLITQDDGVFYSKPMLSTALAQNKTAQTLRNTEAAAMAAELNADIKTHTAIKAIHPSVREVETIEGARLAYSKLVLATGAQPIRLPIKGSGAADVLSVNNLLDYAQFEGRLQGVKKVALLGAGLIGCEFANDLIKSGREVIVFDLAPQPLGRLLPTEAAGRLRHVLAAAGVQFQLENSVTDIEKTDTHYTLQTQKGEALTVDLVLSAVGLRSDTALAAAAGLKINRGIVANDQLQTSDEHIFTLGDCAEVEGQVLPYVMPIMNGARVLAAGLTGSPQHLVYPPMPVMVKTSICPVVVCPPPGPGHWQESVSEEGVVARHVDDAGRLNGFALVGASVRERAALVKEMQG